MATKKPNVRGAYSPRDEVLHVSEGPSLTQQQFKDEVDINNIANRHLPMLANARTPLFGDMPSETFQDMQNRTIDIQQRFLTLPSKLRNRFNNDPYQILRFVENKENKDEAIKLGLIPEPLPAAPAAPAAPAVLPT